MHQIAGQINLWIMMHNQILQKHPITRKKNAHFFLHRKKYVIYLDSGASNHMYGKKELFVDLMENVQSNVSLGDSSKMPVKGKEKIKIYQNDGEP